MTEPLHLGEADRVMVIAPHPDDETLGAGGLLQLAASSRSKVRVLFLTDGDNNPWPQRALELRWRIGAEDRRRWGARRRREALEALRQLGIPQQAAVFLGFPDQGLKGLLERNSEEILTVLCAEISHWRATVLAFPSPRDRHPDHGAAGMLCRLAVSRAAFHPPLQIRYLIHGRIPDGPGSDTVRVALSTEQRARKRRAVLCHRTQMLFHRFTYPQFAREREDFVRVRPSAEVRGALSGKVLAGASLTPSARTDTADAVVCCVIPCYNVGGVCGEVVRGALAHADAVIAVDDGSTDETGEALRRIAAESGGPLRLLSLDRNRGKGCALLAGFRKALESTSFDVLVTLDADRQHHPADIPKLVRACLENHAPLVVGERTDTHAMPIRSRIGNVTTRWIVRLFYPWAPLDTQSGLRALDRRFVEQIVRIIEGSRYETELQILLLALSRGLRIETVPIQALYPNRNRWSHFSPVADSLRILWALLSWRLAGRGV